MLCTLKMVLKGQLVPGQLSPTGKYSPEPAEADDSSKMALGGGYSPAPWSHALEQKHSWGCEAPEKALSA